jgi:hypothetical protein
MTRVRRRFVFDAAAAAAVAVAPPHGADLIAFDNKGIQSGLVLTEMHGRLHSPLHAGAVRVRFCYASVDATWNR